MDEQQEQAYRELRARMREADEEARNRMWVIVYLAGALLALAVLGGGAWMISRGLYWSW